MKTEIWNNNPIRFVEINGEWWAVLKDVCDALNLKTKYIVGRLEDEVVSTDHILDSLGRKQEMLIVNEYGIYDAIFSSKKKEAKEFKKWVYQMLKQLREASGLQGFEIFRQLDKEHQKKQMEVLKSSLRNPVRVDFIKANTITNKVLSNRYGYPKMVKKGEMTPTMLQEREPILEDTVELMGVQERFNLPISVSESIKRKWN